MDDADGTTIEDRLRRFAAMVRSSEHNLVSRRAREELETRHIPECVALADVLPRGPHQQLLDLGSGGGFPGLVIAIVRQEFEVHLLDATAKKTAFLAEAAEELGLSVTVHTGRAEELQRGALAASFDIVTARAVAPLDRLVGWAMPFLRAGGVLYAVKGERWEEELASAEVAMRRHGASVIATPEDLHSVGAAPSGPTPRVVMLGRTD